MGAVRLCWARRRVAWRAMPAARRQDGMSGEGEVDGAGSESTAPRAQGGCVHPDEMVKDGGKMCHSAGCVASLCIARFFAVLTVSPGLRTGPAATWVLSQGGGEVDSAGHVGERRRRRGGRRRGRVPALRASSLTWPTCGFRSPRRADRFCLPARSDSGCFCRTSPKRGRPTSRARARPAVCDVLARACSEGI